MIRRLINASPILFVLLCAFDLDEPGANRADRVPAAPTEAVAEAHAPAFIPTERRYPVLPLARGTRATRPSPRPGN